MSQLLNNEQLSMFKELLASYQPAADVLAAFQSSKFVVLAGPAAAGKDTLRNLLLTMPDSPYTSIISTTSRPMRPNEVDGSTYHFVDAEKMHEGLQAGLYFQADLVHGQQVSALYVDEVTKLHESTIGLSILVVKTEADLRSMKPDLKTIFLVPPDLDTMVHRLHDERGLASEELNRRLRAAEAELETALKSNDYYCLVSDHKERVRDLADDFLRNNSKNTEADRDAREHARQLLTELKSRVL